MSEVTQSATVEQSQARPFNALIESGYTLGDYLSQMDEMRALAVRDAELVAVGDEEPYLNFTALHVGPRTAQDSDMLIKQRNPLQIQLQIGDSYWEMHILPLYAMQKIPGLETVNLVMCISDILAMCEVYKAGKLPHPKLIVGETNPTMATIALHLGFAVTRWEKSDSLTSKEIMAFEKEQEKKEFPDDLTVWSDLQTLLDQVPKLEALLKKLTPRYQREIARIDLQIKQRQQETAAS